MTERIRDPPREVLFPSNVLLTVPATGTDPAALPYSADLRAAIAFLGFTFLFAASDFFFCSRALTRSAIELRPK